MVDSLKSGIIVVGASGHAKVVIDMIEKQGRFAVVFIVDDNPALKGCSLFGYPVLGGNMDLPELARQHDVNQAIVAIGSNEIRAKISEWIVHVGISLVSVVHPSAQIGRGVVISPGSVVMAGAVINSDSMIGMNVIINTGATVDHDCTIGDGVHVAPGCHVCGGVTVGGGALIGAGYTIITNLKLGQNVVIGAGSAVLNDVPDFAKVAGSPAKGIN
jgi:sugar O-acyltransferase (sialic acid O-acetyltransferase NeuD family)